MACLGLLMFLLLHQTFAALEVFAPSPQRTLDGSNVLLTCTFSVDNQQIDLNYLAIIWHFQGNIVLTYNNKGITHKPRMSLNVEAARNGNASLSVTNVTLLDSGIYTCLVVYSPQQIKKEISLDVQATPIILIPNKVVSRNNENTLYCKVTGFFPPDISISWLVDGEVQKYQFMGKLQENNNGTYRVNSTMKITPTDEHRNKTFSCRVHHASLQQPLQEDFQLVYRDETSIMTTIVVCTIVGVLICAIMIGIFLWKQKHRRKAKVTFMVKDIEYPAKMFHGDETTLHCTAPNCREDMCVTWLERRAGKVREIQRSQPRDIEEEEKLLETSYMIRSQKEGPQYSTSLSFIPCVEKHKDVTFICRFVSGKVNREKKFHCETIYGKPQLLQPILRSILVSREMRYLLCLETFYPRDIKISWTCGVGESQEIISSSESFADNPDGTSNVSSEVKISEDLVKDPGFRVLVTWEHDSLDKPGQKELSIRDPEYAWDPVVEEIQTPKLFYNTPVALVCNISEYFPDAVTVKWLRRNDQELCEETDAVCIAQTPSIKSSDNRYSCTAKLMINPTIRNHQGAKYICRVEHPSLESPIERSTRELRVMAKPQMMEPIKITLADSSRVEFSLKLQTFWPKDIEIKWHCGADLKPYEQSHTQTLIKHDDGTADVTSVCCISMNLFNDPQVKVHVRWKHETMDEPESRTLSIRDLPWPPQVTNIVIPKLEDNKPVTLTCNISGYFPDHVTVTWFKKVKGNRTDLPKDATCKTSKSSKQKDKTYSCTASLTFPPSFSSDPGAEFTCRVEHPCLESTIERNIEPIGIGLNGKEGPGDSMAKLSSLQQSRLDHNLYGLSHHECRQSSVIQEDSVS